MVRQCLKKTKHPENVTLSVLTVWNDRHYIGCWYKLSSWKPMRMHSVLLLSLISINHVHFYVVQQLGNNQRPTGVCDAVFAC